VGVAAAEVIVVAVVEKSVTVHASTVEQLTLVTVDVTLPVASACSVKKVEHEVAV